MGHGPVQCLFRALLWKRPKKTKKEKENEALSTKPPAQRGRPPVHPRPGARAAPAKGTAPCKGKPPYNGSFFILAHFRGNPLGVLLTFRTPTSRWTAPAPGTS